MKDLLSQMMLKSSVSSTQEEQIAEMISKYGNYEQFTETFSTELQELAAENPFRAYLGTAPTLACVALGYGKNVLQAWLSKQLDSINRFSNAHVKLSFEQQKQVASILLQQYGYLKVSEMLLFFYRIKQGRYGVFNYAIEPTFFTHSIRLFLEERQNDLKTIRTHLAKEQEKKENRNRKPISYEEYLILKKKKQNGEQYQRGEKQSS